MLHSGGSAQVKDYAGLKEFLESQTLETVKTFREQVLAIIGEYPKEEPLKRVKNALYMSTCTSDPMAIPAVA